MYYIVETIKKTYLCEKHEETDAKTILYNAAEIDLSEDTDQCVAKSYVKNFILGKIRSVSVSTRNIESIQEAEEIAPILEIMLKYIPLAEKNVRANLILEEVTKMASNSKYDQSDD